VYRVLLRPLKELNGKWTGKTIMGPVQF